MTPQISSHCRLLSSFALFLSAAVCLPAFSGDQTTRDGPDGPSITVKFGDIDLNTNVGRSELLNRLSKAADRVCREYAQLYSSLGSSGVYASCYRHALAAAVVTVHHEQLSALFATTSRPNTR